MKFITSLILFSTLSVFHCAYAHEKVVLSYDVTGSNSWIPYYIQNAQNPGILGELIPLVLAESGLYGNQVNLPAARVVKALEIGDVDFDIVSPIWLTKEEKAQYIFSEPIMPITEYIVRLAIPEQKPLDKDSYLNEAIGTVRGYYYHDDEHFQRIDFSSEKELVLALATKRISLAIIGNEPALYWSHQYDVALNLALEHSSGMLHMRIRKEHQPHLARLNETIKRLKANGVVEQLINKYLTTTHLTKGKEVNGGI